MLSPRCAEHGEFWVRDAEQMTQEPDVSLHDAADVVLADLVGRYRVSVAEHPDRARALEPPPAPGAVRIVRLAPDGTDGESLTVVLAADGGVAVHVRRTRVLVLAPGTADLGGRLRALADGLGWTPRG